METAMGFLHLLRLLSNMRVKRWQYIIIGGIIFVGIVGWFALPCSGNAEEIAIIVNKENPIEDCSIEELARIYQGKTPTWKDGSQIMVINRIPTAYIRAIFYKLVLKEQPAKEFYHPGSPIPFRTLIQQSDDAAIRFVSRMPNAISYVSFKAVNDKVKVLEINGVPATDETISKKQYPLHD